MKKVIFWLLCLVAMAGYAQNPVVVPQGATNKHFQWLGGGQFKGGFILPYSTEAFTYPDIPALGRLRFNNTNTVPEWNNGSAWKRFAVMVNGVEPSITGDITIPVTLQAALTGGSEGQVDEPVKINAGTGDEFTFNGGFIGLSNSPFTSSIGTVYNLSGQNITSYTNTFSDGVYSTGGNTSVMQGTNTGLEAVLHTAAAGTYVHTDDGANTTLTASSDVDGNYQESKVIVDSFGGVTVTSNNDIELTKDDGNNIKTIKFDPERIQLKVDDIDGYGGTLNIDDEGVSMSADIAAGRTTLGFFDPVATNTILIPSPTAEDIYYVPLNIEGSVADDEGSVFLPTFFRLNADSPTTTIVKYWVGTQAEYEAEVGYDSATLYFITDAPNPYYERDATIVTTQTAANLNSSRPNAPVGYILDCPAIPSTPTRYVKSTASGNWIPSALQTELTP